MNAPADLAAQRVEELVRRNGHIKPVLRRRLADGEGAAGREVNVQ